MKAKSFLTKALKWLVPFSGVAAAILGLITGQYSLAIWACFAASFSWIAAEYIELLEHAVEYGDAMMLDNLKISSELCDAKLKIVELQVEIDRLKKKKVIKARVKSTGEIVEVDDALSIEIERKLVENLTRWFDINFFQAGSEIRPTVFSFFDLMEDARQSLMGEIEKSCIDLTKE